MLLWKYHKREINKETGQMSEQTITRIEELENVRTAYFLEKTISNLESEIKNHYRHKVKKPVIPTKPVIKSEEDTIKLYPKIDTSQVKRPQTWKKGFKISGLGIIVSIALNIIGFIVPFLLSIALLSGFIIFGGIVYAGYLFLEDGKKKKVLIQQYVEQVKKSPDYQNQCHKIDEQIKQEYSQQLERYNRDIQNYNEELAMYENELFPQWEEEKNAFQTAKADTKSALDEVYSKNIIPAQYRNLSAVLYFTAFIGTSQYDLQSAIANYDSYVMRCNQSKQIELAEIQVQIMRETLENQQYANYLQEQMLDIAENSNDVLRSISRWQKADIAIRELRRIKAKNAAH